MNDETQIEIPSKPGPKPGKAAQKTAELEALRARVAELEGFLNNAQRYFPSMVAGAARTPDDDLEALARDIFIRLVVADPSVAFKPQRECAVAAATVFYADPAEE